MIEETHNAQAAEAPRKLPQRHTKNTQIAEAQLKGFFQMGCKRKCRR